MATVTVKMKLRKKRVFGPEDNGILLTPADFDRADFDDDHRFELINGVLVASPIPSEREVNPNDELGYMLRAYRDNHPKGSAMNGTMPKRYVKIGDNRRRPDRLIWASLGRQPKRRELPSIVVEFVSQRKCDRVRDYETKKIEFMSAKIQEYWVIDRFLMTMTVYTQAKDTISERVLTEKQTYRTDLLPGFELPLKRLFAKVEFYADEPAEE